MPKNRIKVFARFKPTENFPHDSIECTNDGTSITIHSKKDDKSYLRNTAADFKFTVDGTLLNASQEETYEKVVSKMTCKALKGFNCTLLAYGQTGAGKTFTISGATENYKLRGIIPRTVSKVFSAIEEESDKVFSVRISYMEIYNESAYDLLATMSEAELNEDKKSLEKVYRGNSGGNLSFIDNPDGRVQIRGLSMHGAGNEGDALNLFFEGETNRSIAAHSLNKNSSRSHCIFTIYIESRSRSESNAKYVSSKFHLVDLAGSERINKTNSEGQTKVEALYINKSLSYLEQTVTAMAERYRTHIPYRQTKLTHALKDSLGGKCPTTLICNVYADEAYLDETMATLRFGARMMRVPVDATPNEFYDPQAKFNELSDEVRALKLELSMHDALVNRTGIEYEALSENQLAEIKVQVKNFLEGKTGDVDVHSMRHLGAIFMQFRALAAQMEADVTRELRGQFVLVDRQDSDAVGALHSLGYNLDEDPSAPGAGSGHESPAKKKDGRGSKEASKKKGRSSGKSQQPPQQAVVAPQKAGSRPPNVGSSASMTDKRQNDGKSNSRGGEHDHKARDDSARGGAREGSFGSSDSFDDKHHHNHHNNRSPSRPGTPPPRSDAYEEFKRERGQEIARILNENKTILQSKKRIVRDLAHAVNASKHMIDGARIALERKRQEREEQGEYVAAGVDGNSGEVVIDEEEFELVSQLKRLKRAYRSDYNALRNAKSEVDYCERLVKQCRERLVREFDNWYNEMFLHDGDYHAATGHLPLGSRAARGGGVPVGRFPGPPHLVPPAEAYIDDENEKFDRLQQDNAESREAAVFQNAKLRTQRRKVLEKTYQQTQPAGSYAHSVKIGAPKVSVRNRPPNQMSIY